MLKLDSTISTIAVAFVAAAAVSALLTWQPNAMTPGALANTAGAQSADAAKKASAGRFGQSAPPRLAVDNTR